MEKGGNGGSMKERLKDGEKKGFNVCKWVGVRREHWGLRGWV